MAYGCLHLILTFLSLLIFVCLQGFLYELDKVRETLSELQKQTKL